MLKSRIFFGWLFVSWGQGVVSFEILINLACIKIFKSNFKNVCQFK
jgi:hypothetical protein